ncbi:hypothetical protein CYK37_21455 [Mesorhizobium loti]|nr:hypothetical protein CYK37_21455 [Mesorhizobium loti]
MSTSTCIPISTATSTSTTTSMSASTSTATKPRSRSTSRPMAMTPRPTSISSLRFRKTSGRASRQPATQLPADKPHSRLRRILPPLRPDRKRLRFVRGLFYWAIEQFREKCVAVFRPELRKNKGSERFGVSENGNAPAAGQGRARAERRERRIRSYQRGPGLRLKCNST